MAQPDKKQKSKTKEYKVQPRSNREEILTKGDLHEDSNVTNVKYTAEKVSTKSVQSYKTKTHTRYLSGTEQHRPGDNQKHSECTEKQNGEVT